MALRYDLRINQGESFRVTIPVLDDAGDPVDVTSMVARGHVRAGQNAADPLYEWSAGAGNLTLDVGIVILEVPAGDSTGWGWRSGLYDLEVTDPATSTTTRLVEGIVYVNPEITRS